MTQRAALYARTHARIDFSFPRSPIRWLEADCKSGQIDRKSAALRAARAVGPFVHIRGEDAPPRREVRARGFKRKGFY